MLLNVRELKKLVSQAEAFLMTSDFIPILQHVWFYPHHVVAFNDIQAVQLEFSSGLHCAVPGKIFSKLLGTQTSDELMIEHVGDKLLVGSGRNQTKLPVLPPSEYVFTFPELKGESIVLTEDMLKGMEKCLITVSHDPTRPERNGVCLKVTDEEVAMFTTDGKTISRFVMEGSFSVAKLEQLWVILPTFFCDQLCRLVKEYKTNVQLYVDSEMVVAVVGNNKIFSRLINATPPKFEAAIQQIMPNIMDLVLVPIPDLFMAVLNRALLMVYPEKGITTSRASITKDGNIQLHTESDRGRAHDDVEAGLKDVTEEVMDVETALLHRGVDICQLFTVKNRTWVFSTEDKSFVHLVSVKG